MIEAIDLRRDFLDNGAFKEVLNWVEDRLIKEASRPESPRHCTLYIHEMGDYDKDVYYELIDGGYRVHIYESYWTIEW